MIKLGYPDIGLEEFEEIKKVLMSRNLVQGEKVFEFENEIKNFLNVKHVFAVSSGTAALHLALLALEIGQGDEVIVPNLTFPATANVVELVGAKTVLVDINIESLCIDVTKIEKLITENTKAIIPVHEFGETADMDKIIELANKYNLYVIEDAACALGAEYKGKKAGTIGELGCFSLHPRKSITTGEGGIIVTNNEELAKKISSMRNHGIGYVDGKVKFITAGLNYRLTDFQGAMGLVQLKKLDILNNDRKRLANEYNRLLKNINNIKLPSEEIHGNRVWQTYHILLNDDIDRDALILKLKEEGIEVNLGAYTVHNQPYYKEKYNLDDYEFKNSIIANEFGLALPLHSKLTSKDVNYIICTLGEYIGD